MPFNELPPDIVLGLGVHSRSTLPAVQRIGTIVIGGGQAGLAVGRELAKRDLDFLILDARRQVGDVWRHRWDSLRLFTPAEYSGLPDMPFPAPPKHFPDRDEVADYLQRYVERFELPVQSATLVSALRWNGERYEVETADALFEAANVVVAAGPFQRPLIPNVASQLSSGIHQLHSSDYRNPFELPEGPVLVVGAGTSGAQIALELSKTRKVWLAGRNTGRLPRRVLGRDLFDWIWPMINRATLDTFGGRQLRQRAGDGGDALIGLSTRDLHRAGVIQTGRLHVQRGGLPVCDDGVLQPRVVIWCTGFVPDYSWIRVPVFDSDGVPRHRRGIVVGAPGLFFAGLRFQYRLNSSLIGGVGADAAFVAQQIELRVSEAQCAERE